MSTEAWRPLWAKSDPYHLLWRHLLDAAAVCEALLPCFGGVPGLPDEWVCLLVGLHDIGKADPEFQIKAEGLVAGLLEHGIPLAPSQERFRHEARSAEFLRGFLKSYDWNQRAITVVCTSINGHHGNFQAKTGTMGDYSPEWWTAVRQELAQLLVSYLAVEPVTIGRMPDASLAALKLSALTVLSDWIASNPDLYPYTSLECYHPPAEYFAEARKLAKERVAVLQFGAAAGDPVETPLLFRELFNQERFPSMETVRPVQQKLEELAVSGNLPPGLVIIEDRMGEGKSEAAMYLAEHWSRMRGRTGAYLALPTAATSNQMHGRYQIFLRKTRGTGPMPRLIHGMAWLAEDDTPRAAAQTFGEEHVQPDGETRHWFRNARRALLAQEGVGTVDQVLMAALNVPFGVLRLLGLSRKVLVIDEVHAYDEFMTVIMERLLQWCRALEIPVVLLSATLSLRQKERLLAAYGAELPENHRDAYPLITAAPLDSLARSWTVEIQPRHPGTVRLVPYPGLLNDPEATAALAVQQVRDGGCCCVLMNTVAGAQDVFQKLCRLQRDGSLPADTELILFHARFRAGGRNARESQVVDRFGRDAGKDGRPPRPHRAILVATQVVEQSLDVDFDVMISQIAPIDLLLQRLGRMHRHAGRERYGHAEAVLHVLLPGPEHNFGPTERVYCNLQPLLRTLALVHAERSIRCPQDFRGLVTACYDGGAIPLGIATDAALRDAEATHQKEDRLAEEAALVHLLAEPDPDHAAFTDYDPSAEGEEGEQRTRLRARTRLGESTARVLVLHDGEWSRVMQQAVCPPTRVLRKLLLHHAAVPRWWLSAEPASGFEALDDAPKWLRNYRLLRLQNREWRGVGGRDGAAPMTIRDDEHLGLILTHEERANDADV